LATACLLNADKARGVHSRIAWLSSEFSGVFAVSGALAGSGGADTPGDCACAAAQQNAMLKTGIPNQTNRRFMPIKRNTCWKVAVSQFLLTGSPRPDGAPLPSPPQPDERRV